MNDATASMVERLTQLGFSQYEAKTYVGLLVNGEQTGYALSNLTGVPQPKVYETLRRLLERKISDAHHESCGDDALARTGRRRVASRRRDLGGSF